MRVSIRSTPFGHGAPEESICEFGQLLGVAGRRPLCGLRRRLLERQLRASSPVLLRVPQQSLGSTAALPVVCLQAGKLLCVSQTCMQLGVEGDASLCMNKHPIDISMASWRSPTRRRHVSRRRRSLLVKQHGRRSARTAASFVLRRMARGAALDARRVQLVLSRHYDDACLADTRAPTSIHYTRKLSTMLALSFGRPARSRHSTAWAFWFGSTRTRFSCLSTLLQSESKTLAVCSNRRLPRGVVASTSCSAAVIKERPRISKAWMLPMPARGITFSRLMLQS